MKNRNRDEGKSILCTYDFDPHIAVDIANRRLLRLHQTKLCTP